MEWHYGITKSRETEMKLTELVGFLNRPDQLALMVAGLGLDYESDEVLVYMKERLHLESDLRFFRLFETDDDLIFIQDGINYVQLFPLKYMVRLAQFDLGITNSGFNDQQIAQRLLRYRIKDA